MHARGCALTWIRASATATAATLRASSSCIRPTASASAAAAAASTSRPVLPGAATAPSQQQDACRLHVTEPAAGPGAIAGGLALGSRAVTGSADEDLDRVARNHSEARAHPPAGAAARGEALACASPSGAPDLGRHVACVVGRDLIRLASYPGEDDRRQR